MSFQPLSDQCDSESFLEGTFVDVRAWFNLTSYHAPPPPPPLPPGHTQRTVRKCVPEKVVHKKDIYNE